MNLVKVIYGLILLPMSLNATPLSSAVANCPIGQFCKVNMSNLTPSIIDATNQTIITGYASKAAWDNVNSRFYFVGGGHLTCVKFVTYDDASDKWTSVVPPWAPCPNPGNFFYHSYQHNTFDPVSQRLYVRRFYGGFADVYDVGTQSWSVTASQAEVTVQVSGGLEYFPDIDKVVHFGIENSTFGALWAYEKNNNSWSQIGVSNSYATGSYDNFAVYSTKHHFLMFGGGGSSNIFKVDALGIVSPLTSAPLVINDATPNGTITTADPVSGNLLVIDASGTIHELNLSSSAKGDWGVLSVKAPFVNATSGGGVYGVVAAQMANYGVIGFLVCGGLAYCSGNSSPQFYIYKHKQGTGVPIPVDLPPAAPKNLVVN